MPMVRTNKMFAGIIVCFITYITLPKPDPLQSYRSTREGTKVARFMRNRNNIPEQCLRFKGAAESISREGDNL